MANGQLSEKDKALLKVVDEVLHYIWDPIQIVGIPQARDEYQNYVPQVFSLLRSGATDTVISAHLQSIAVDRMGLNACQAQADEAATTLVDWLDFIEHGGAPNNSFKPKPLRGSA
jgi:hypothetical protein